MATEPEKKKLIGNLKRAGVPRNEIARRLHMSTPRVDAVLRELGMAVSEQQAPGSDEGWWRQGSIKANVGWREGFEAEAEAGSWYAQKVLAERAAAPVETEREVAA